MITSKKAVEIAFTYMRDMFPEEKEFELEEIDLSSNKNEWEITLSYPDKNITSAGILFNQGIASRPRKYKSLVIDGEDGSVHSMKIRQVG